MARHSLEQALILTSRQAGEDNRIITMLSPGRGVLDAMLYGGRKSRLRSMVSPWHSGRIWLYHDHSRNTAKITDFEPLKFRATLRENLYKNMAASLATEFVIKTRAAAEPQATWNLLCGFLDGLELSAEDACRKGLLRFLWRYIGLLGERPDCASCARCAEPLARDGDARPEEAAAFYVEDENGFLCAECARGTDGGMKLTAEAVRYLSAAAAFTGSRARTMPLSVLSESQVRSLVLHLVTVAAGFRLRTMDAAIGIL